MPTLELSTEVETRTLGSRLAAASRKGDVITLSGPLGVGKTELARGFIKHLAGEQVDVSSPTFTLINVYDSAKPPVWHFDLYRLEDENEMAELGLDEACAIGISLIEWPDRAGLWLPSYCLAIELSINADSQTRLARIAPGPGWKSRLDDVLAHAV